MHHVVLASRLRLQFADPGSHNTAQQAAKLTTGAPTLPAHCCRVTALFRADPAPEVPSLAAALQLTTDLLEVLEEVDADTRLQVCHFVRDDYHIPSRSPDKGL